MGDSPRVSVEQATCSLLFEPLQPRDGGLYKCGERSLELLVMVEPGHPSIVQGRGNGGQLEVEAGQEVQLQCESQGGSPPAEIVWREEGQMEIQELEGIEQEVIRREDGLTFKTVEKNQSSCTWY